MVKIVYRCGSKKDWEWLCRFGVRWLWCEVSIPVRECEGMYMKGEMFL